MDGIKHCTVYTACITLCSVIHLPAPEPVHHVLMAVLDPLDPSVQKWAHLLKVLRVVSSCDITVFLNPQNKLSEVPIKRYGCTRTIMGMSLHSPSYVCTRNAHTHILPRACQAMRKQSD